METINPIPPAPEGAVLQAALFTSYRPVAPGFMLSEVLPQLIGVRRRAGEDVKSRDWFIAEAINALEPLVGRLTLITSTPCDGDTAIAESWLNHFVTPYCAGRTQDHIQHAKLWLCHWLSKEGPLLQITVSSTNLTTDAFRGQIQAGWTKTIQIGTARLPRGESLADGLDVFLGDLGESANCGDRTSYFINLLRYCPRDPSATFVASVPGRASPLESFRKAAAGQTAPSWMRVMTPSIGNWSNSAELVKWCEGFGILPKQIQLVWPAKTHPWTGGGSHDDGAVWNMPEPALKAIKSCGIKLQKVPDADPDRIFDIDMMQSGRWSHAKLYQCRSGLLIGSHNWSRSAWGVPGKETPKNFELSVFVRHARLPIELGEGELDYADVAVCEVSHRDPSRHWLKWVEASWDGSTLCIQARTSLNSVPNAQWFDGKSWRSTGEFKLSGDVWTSMCVCGTIGPRRVRIWIDDEKEAAELVSVIDKRPSKYLPQEISEPVAELADRILLEAYGGPPADVIDGLPVKRPRKKSKNEWQQDVSADYRPAWLVSTRRWAKVVDAWRSKAPDLGPQRAIADARRLSKALRRIAATGDVGARLAAEELQLLGEEQK